MRSLLRSFACLATAVSLLSCGPASYPSSLQLSDGGLIPNTTCSADRTVCWTITPSSAQAVNDGNTPSNMVVTLSQGGTAVPDGSAGSFSFTGNNSASFVAIAAGVPNTTTFQGSTSNGQITLQVYDLGVETVTLDMTANIIYPNSSATLTGTQTIHFGGTCSDSFITPASSTSSVSGIPANITFHCNDPVMGGSFAYQQSHPYDGNTQSCTAFVADVNDQGVASAAVQFLTEAGAVETDVVTPRPAPHRDHRQRGRSPGLLSRPVSIPRGRPLRPNSRPGHRAGGHQHLGRHRNAALVDRLRPGTPTTPATAG